VSIKNAVLSSSFNAEFLKSSHTYNEFFCERVVVELLTRAVELCRLRCNTILIGAVSLKAIGKIIPCLLDARRFN
jgi:hypothetical protein